MANIGESLINVVTGKQAKGADKLEPKRYVMGMGVPVSLIVDKNITGGQAEPNPSGHQSGTWEIRISPDIGKANCKES
jgi:hypothetical protein